LPIACCLANNIVSEISSKKYEKEGLKMRISLRKYLFFLIILVVSMLCSCNESQDPTSKIAKVEPPASFIDAPMLYNDHVYDRITQCGASVGKWIEAGDEGGEKSWEKNSENQWILTVVEVNKKTSQKHTVLLQFDKVEEGVKLSRVVIDNDEYSPERVKNMSLDLCGKALKNMKK
jgi:hypothetical protein